MDAASAAITDKLVIIIIFIIQSPFVIHDFFLNICIYFSGVHLILVVKISIIENSKLRYIYIAEKYNNVAKEAAHTMRKMNIDKNQMEFIDYKASNFQFRANRTQLSEFEQGKIYGHWHLEYEIIYVHAGRVYCKVNEKEYLLEAGDCLFINSNMVHMFWPKDEEDCRYSAVGFTPKLLAHTDSLVREKYVDQITECAALDSFLLRAQEEWQQDMLYHLMRAENIWFEQDDCQELKIMSHIFHFWSTFYEHTKHYLDRKRLSGGKDVKLKDILLYLHSHYTEKITLDGLARATGMSKSSCNHIFKAYMKESVFDYLLRYRIDMSLPMLLKNDMSITEIALGVGFSGASYYTEIFRRYKYMTPQEYKKRNR